MDLLRLYLKLNSKIEYSGYKCDLDLFATKTIFSLAQNFDYSNNIFL